MKQHTNERLQPQRLSLAAAVFAVLWTVVPCLAQDQSEPSPQTTQKLGQQLAQQRRDLEQQQVELQRQLQQIAEQKARLETQFAEASRQFEQMRAQQSQPVPEQPRQLKIFELKYIPGNQAIGMIGDVLGRNAPRMAIDERSNHLVAVGTDEQIKTIGRLLDGLDVTPSDSAASMITREAALPAAQTVQIRVIWAIEDPENYGAEEGDRFDPPVRDALDKLGFGSPRIVCDPITSLLVSKGGSNQFAFEVPVVLEGSVVRFKGAGRIEAADGDHYLVRVQLSVDTPIGQGNALNCKVQGAISTPLGNYTVLGTGVTIGAQTTTTTTPKSIPSAFIVQLIRPKDIPSTGDKPKAK
jgi:hypothetical protein